MHAPLPAGHTFREIAYEEHAGVGYLHFDFYNGAMSTEQCRRLREAYLLRPLARADAGHRADGRHATSSPTASISTSSRRPTIRPWSPGATCSAIDDVVREIVETDSHLVISALAGDAAAGGVPFALAADHVVAREDVVLNPYYRHMGGLYGSEYWTYLLPRRVGAEHGRPADGAPFTPVGTRRAVEIGLLDAAFGDTADELPRPGPRARRARSRATPASAERLEDKRRRRARDEQIKPLSAYRNEELARSHECFFGEDRSYHEARHRFVYKLGAPCALTRRSSSAGRRRRWRSRPSSGARRPGGLRRFRLGSGVRVRQALRAAGVGRPRVGCGAL